MRVLGRRVSLSQLEVHRFRCARELREEIAAAEAEPKAKMAFRVWQDSARGWMISRVQLGQNVQKLGTQQHTTSTTFAKLLMNFFLL